MSARAALATGTVLSLTVTSGWAWTADITQGPAAPLHLGRNLASDYAQLPGEPAGNDRELFAAVAVIYTVCLLVSSWRRHRQDGG
jgi:hypothetical protein